MGSRRRSSGSVARQGRRWYAVLSLPSGRRHWEPIPDDGEPLERADAKDYARRLQRELDAGRWHPQARRAASTPTTFYAHVHAFVSRQSYESQPKELRAVVRYLKGCPIAETLATALRPRHGITLLEYLKAFPSERGGTLGHNPVISVFNTCERALDALVVDEIVAANPFRLEAVHAHLPERRDAKPGARATWRFPERDVITLTTDERVPEDHVVVNGLAFYAGERPGEIRANRIGDVHLDERPLGRLDVARAIKSVSRVEGGTKTEAIKHVPIVPQLARILRAWIDGGGWERAMGRPPRPDDWLVPNVRGRRKGQPRNDSAMARAFRADQERVQIAPSRHMYTTRHTCVRMLRDAEAAREITRWATHAPPKSVLDGYADAPPWSVLCREFGKLATLLERAGVEANVETPPESGGVTGGSTEESKLRSAVANRENPSGCGVGHPTESATRGPLSLKVSTPSEPLTPYEQLRASELVQYAWAERVLLAEIEREEARHGN